MKEEREGEGRGEIERREGVREWEREREGREEKGREGIEKNRGNKG